MAASPHTPVAPADPAGLYARHRAWLLLYCARRLRSRDEGEDAVQQTFVYALGCLARGVVPRHEEAWLRTIAENVCRATVRRAPRRLEATADVEQLPAAEHDAGAAGELAGAVAALPRSQREALLLREWQGLSYREIATALATTESAVETLLVRARRRVAQSLTDGRRALDAGSALAALRSLLGTGAGKAAALAAVGCLATGTAVVSVPYLHAKPSSRPAPRVQTPGAPESSARLPTLAARPARILPHAGRTPAPAPAGVTRRNATVASAGTATARPAAAPSGPTPAAAQPSAPSAAAGRQSPTAPTPKEPARARVPATPFAPTLPGANDAVGAVATVAGDAVGTVTKTAGGAVGDVSSTAADAVSTADEVASGTVAAAGDAASGVVSRAGGAASGVASVPTPLPPVTLP